MQKEDGMQNMKQPWGAKCCERSKMFKGDLGKVLLCKVQFNCLFQSLMEFSVKIPFRKVSLGIRVQ